jgi:hypothetical protein
MRHTHHSHQLSLLQKARLLPERKVSAVAYSGESHLLQVLFIFLALLIGGYFYFVGVSIMNVISNREASVESDRLRSVVGSLEEEYFALAKSVTPESAGSLGLTASVETSYVRRVNAVASNANPSGI